MENMSMGIGRRRSGAGGIGGRLRLRRQLFVVAACAFILVAADCCGRTEAAADEENAGGDLVIPSHSGFRGASANNAEHGDRRSLWVKEFHDWFFGGGGTVTTPPPTYMPLAPVSSPLTSWSPTRSPSQPTDEVVHAPPPPTMTPVTFTPTRKVRKRPNHVINVLVGRPRRDHVWRIIFVVRIMTGSLYGGEGRGCTLVLRV